MSKKNLSFYLVGLLAIGFMAKGLSLVTRIVIIRTIGIEAMSIATLINPLVVLIITFASFSLPNVIGTLISKNPENSKKIIISSFILGTGISLILMIGLIFLAPIISNNLLNNPKTLYCIYACSLLVPLVTISSIIKGYFIGNNELYITAFSQVFEEGSRLVFVSLIFYFIVVKDDAILATFNVFALCVGEVFQSFFMLVFSPRKYQSRFKDLFIAVRHKENYMISNVVKLSLPLTFSRAVGSLTYFLEPIIVTTLLVKTGIDSNQVTVDYGILAGYVMPLLLMPGFFSLALSNYLLPNLTKLFYKNKLKESKALFKKICLISLSIGLVISTCFFFFGDFILELLYHTSEGKDLIKLLAFPFLIYYIETPIAISMQALNLTHKAFKATIYSSIARILTLLLFTVKLGTFAVALATIVSVYLDVSLNLIDILSVFKRKNKKTINQI